MRRWAFVLLVLTFGSSPSAFAKERELVVLVLVDAMRPDHMSAYGYKKDTTPVLAELATSARRYTRVYTNAPWTRPSTTSFLTGLNASRHRTETAKSKLPQDVVTLAERLHQAGYKTAGFVANGNGGSLAGLERGFDIFADPTNTYTKTKRGPVYANSLPAAPFVVEQALAHLQDEKAEKEFLFLFLVDPHDPYGASPELEQAFLGKDFHGKPRRTARWEYDNAYPEDERASMQALYDAGIKQADQALGTFFRGLKQLGLYDKATIMVSADHGEGFGEHGFYLHAHQFWDEVTRIPLIVKGPKFQAGVDERLTQAIDVPKTVLALAGATSDLPGRSLLDPAVADPVIYSEYNEFGIHRQAVIDSRYKVVWQRPADGAVFDAEVKDRKWFPSVSFDKETVHAFDLQADPGEKQNIAASLPARAEALLGQLRAFVTGPETQAAQR